MACKEAGLSEEQTAEIRRFFDAEKKRVKYDMECREQAGVVFNSLRGLVEEYDLDEYEVPDHSINVEETILHKLEIEKLRECMDELSAEDREFLLVVFSGDFGAKSSYARQHNCSEAAVTRRKDHLLNKLRKKFFKKI
jgi:DNA-directed RNA polymerase specialized sigma24 family protein